MVVPSDACVELIYPNARVPFCPSAAKAKLAVLAAKWKRNNKAAAPNTNTYQYVESMQKCAPARRSGLADIVF